MLRIEKTKVLNLPRPNQLTSIIESNTPSIKELTGMICSDGGQSAHSVTSGLHCWVDMRATKDRARRGGGYAG